MYDRPLHPGLLQIAAGYICAVMASAVVTALLMAMGGGGDDFLTLLMVGGSFIAVGGLPGFVATMILARHFNWTGWAPFALAGGINALLAWTIVSGAPMMFGANDLLTASVRGGVAGGVCFWWSTYGRSRGPLGA